MVPNSLWINHHQPPSQSLRVLDQKQVLILDTHKDIHNIRNSFLDLMPSLYGREPKPLLRINRQHLLHTDRQLSPRQCPLNPRLVPDHKVPHKLQPEHPPILLIPIHNLMHEHSRPSDPRDLNLLHISK